MWVFLFARDQRELWPKKPKKQLSESSRRAGRVSEGNIGDLKLLPQLWRETQRFLVFASAALWRQNSQCAPDITKPKIWRQSWSYAPKSLSSPRHSCAKNRHFFSFFQQIHHHHPPPSSEFFSNHNRIWHCRPVWVKLMSIKLIRRHGFLRRWMFKCWCWFPNMSFSKGKRSWYFYQTSTRPNYVVKDSRESKAFLSPRHYLPKTSTICVLPSHLLNI